MIRRATERDTARLAEIYNQSILAGEYATADTEPVTRENRLQWLRAHPDEYPVFVWEATDGRVLGWAALSRFSLRPEWPGMAEPAVYVDRKQRSGIVAAQLSTALLHAAQVRDIRYLVALIFARNDVSLRGALAVGFERATTFPQATFFRGRWEDIVCCVLDLRATTPRFLGSNTTTRRGG